ncbi:HAMP domain-containing sensor histidine kinase [Anaeromicropila populeti]|uniref:histidine kinase n=1 Tax=Anaeromicropila populeti TaxID=37658 RepID=A0A1I6I5Q5_9FIRM|nr:HAMP domain-containing sensor histidine kinase [Anaeromicropila populeti]SFR62031.1 HAMP domain-containing protein [Anaeromicropila populeti]
MKIRNRLVMSFVIIISLPLFLITTTTGAILYYTMSSIRHDYNIDTDNYIVLMNPVVALNDVIKDIFCEVKDDILSDPSLLDNVDYVSTVNEELKSRHSFIVVKKEEEAVYIGNREKYKEVETILPGFGNYTADSDAGLYSVNLQPYLIRKFDFYYTDNSKGCLYILTDVNTLLPQVKSSSVKLLVSIIIVICLTALILTLWIYRGMIQPLNILRTSIYRMKNGDFNFEIQAESDDEIGMLCEDFDEMRKRIKMLMEERLASEEEMRVLISNISHDLKTPLTAIRGYAEGIIDGVADTPDKMERYVKTIYTKTNDITHLVDELSFYTKIDCNTVPYNFVKVNVEQYFSDCINDWQLDLEVKNIALKYFNYAHHGLEMIADVEQLKRVINNIMGNAVKYIDKEQGQIKVIIKETENMVSITISDNGKGIGEKDLTKIFERFYRTDASRNSSKGGSGLGLAISKKIIMDHGGIIWAESKEGEGTSISFTLKQAREEQEDENYTVLNKTNRRMGDVKW